MKNLLHTVAVVLLCLTFFSTSALAANTILPSDTASVSTLVAPDANATENLEALRASQLELRLEEIKAMDISSMNRDEKKALRQETKSIKQELNDLGGGVYITAGGIIIILLLLILLF
jgi:predicted PurR-regulated permease PerM